MTEATTTFYDIEVCYCDDCCETEYQNVLKRGWRKADATSTEQQAHQAKVEDIYWLTHCRGLVRYTTCEGKKPLYKDCCIRCENTANTY